MLPNFFPLKKLSHFLHFPQFLLLSFVPFGFEKRKKYVETPMWNIDVHSLFSWVHFTFLSITYCPKLGYNFGFAGWPFWLILWIVKKKREEKNVYRQMTLQRRIFLGDFWGLLLSSAHEGYNVWAIAIHGFLQIQKGSFSNHACNINWRLTNAPLSKKPHKQNTQQGIQKVQIKVQLGYETITTSTTIGRKNENATISAKKIFQLFCLTLSSTDFFHVLSSGQKLKLSHFHTFS